MKTLVAFLLLTCISAIATETADSASSTSGTSSKLDSVVKAEQDGWQADSLKYSSLRKVDSIRFDSAASKLPDSIRTEIYRHRAEIDVRIAEFQKLKAAEIRTKLDSLQAVLKTRRNAEIAKLTTTEQVRIKAHIADIDAKRDEIRARIEASRSEIERRIAAAKAAKAATP